MDWILLSTRSLDPFDPPLGTILDFLFEFHEKGLEYTTLNTARIDISAFTIPNQLHY